MLNLEEFARLVYEDKAEFVEKLNRYIVPYLLLEQSILRIEYDMDEESELETVTIEYLGGHKDVINVSMNSKTAILLEVARQLSGEGAYGLIKGV